jgi:hypothetical protein
LVLPPCKSLANHIAAAISHAEMAVFWPFVIRLREFDVPARHQVNVIEK